MFMQAIPVSHPAHHRKMLKQMSVHIVPLLVILLSQRCCVSSVGAPGDTIGVVNRFNSPQEQQHLQQQQQHHLQQQQQQHAAAASYHSQQQLSSHRPSVVGSGGHLDHRNSYNLLSEAMSQAVSNEFSSVGSGSADGSCHADDLECGNVQDRLGMEAITMLHRQLDDDDNGNIDLSESDDFLREELKYDSGYEKRQKAFHFNDDMHISVKELWEAWLRSEVHNWTIEQTTDWLAQSVQLPQYVEIFKLHKVAGAALPRLAVNNMHYVGSVLGIKDPIHKQKIALKAMDVVLFGPPRETGTRWKDYILVTLLLSAIIGCWYAYQQNKNAKRHLRRMAQDMEGLQRAEQSLQEMQKELERARMEQENVATEKMDLERRLKEAPSLSSSSSDLEVQQLKKEIEMLRSELSRAEIELVDNCWAPPPQLQSWLQYTYELESKNHLKKRVAAEKQLQSAREACEKLRKKRSSLVGAFVSTHGKSIDDVDRSIVEARNSLGDVTHELQERLHRWKQIESCLGLNIVNNNGLSYLESVLYGRNGGTTSKGSRGRMTNSTDDLDDESVQGMLESYCRSSVGSLPSGSNISGSGIGGCNTTLRDDSSGSEDGTDTQSVQFYLGNVPPAGASASAALGLAPTPTSTPLSTIANATSACSNNVVAHLHNSHGLPVTTSAHSVAPAQSAAPSAASMQSTGTVVTSNASGITTIAGSCAPPPLPPHSNATYNDRDGSRRHSPSVSSSDCSSAVPPRMKKQQVFPAVVPPPPSLPIGRAPLPPPRKSPTQSQQKQKLRATLVNAELVPMEVYTYLRQQQQLQQQPIIGHKSSSSGYTICGGNNVGAGSGAGLKKMVKQHSTASQQSSSSTSSSVQSAPAASDASGGGIGGGGGEPSSNSAGASTPDGRWSISIHEHQLLLQQQQYQHQLQRQLAFGGDQDSVLQSRFTATSTKTAGSAGKTGSLQSLFVKSPQQQPPTYDFICGGSGGGVSGSRGQSAAGSTTSASTVASSYSDTLLEEATLVGLLHPNSDTASLDGSTTGSIKKRKRRLRFPFVGGSNRKSNSSDKEGKAT